MSSTPKKLRGGPTIAVDDQIARWRKKLKKKGIKLGSNMEQAEKNAVRSQLDRDVKSGAVARKKWF